MPTGTVTFLFTDLEGSTRLWEKDPMAMRDAVARHEGILRAAIAAHGGVVFRTVGDGLCAAFDTAPAAVAAAFAAQRDLCAEPWAEAVPLRVRIVLHTGAVEVRAGDYVGACLNRLGRLLAAAHGGQVLLSQATADLARDSLPPGAGLRDLGEQRLRDLERPERVFQLAHPALPTDFPPLRSLGAYPNNLPIQITSFVGRENELADLGRALATTRLLTLTGTGGCGKTRLALEVGAGLLEAYPDGVWLVELAPLADAALVPDAVAAALGVRGGPGQPIQAALLSFLRTRRLLLILDNCEHLLDPCARLTDLLLRSCLGVRILATSREGLGIAGEVAWRVPSLALPPADEPGALALLASNEAIRLFVDRAGAVRPGFALTARNAPVVARICRRLDGIPLALELAASRVRALTVDQVAVRLDQRFRFLTGGSRAALPRQQTLAATVGWSYDLLSEAERTLFDRLSVFAGGFTLEAAEAVCAVADDGDARAPDPALRPLPSDEVADLLTSLVGKSLVVAELSDGPAGRYRLLETLRQYGRERLVAAGEAEAIPRRHAAHYRDLALDAEPHLHRPEQLAHLARLDLERDNVRAALRWYLQAGDGPAGLGLTGALLWYWWIRGLMLQGLDWHTRFLGLPNAAPSGPMQAVALAWAGLIAFVHGDLAASRRHSAAGLAVARETGDDRTVAWAMIFASRFGGADKEHWYGAGERELAEGALARFRDAGDRLGVAQALSTLGQLAYVRGDREVGRGLLLEGVDVARATGDRGSVAFALEFLGRAISEVEGHEAATRLGESLRLYRALGDLTGVASVENLLGRLDWLHGASAAAGEHYRASLRLTRDWSWLLRIAESLAGLAVVAAGQDQPARALRLGAAAIRLRVPAPTESSPDAQAELDRAMATARERLGEGAAATLVAEGQAMTLEEAVAYALADEGGPGA